MSVNAFYDAYGATQNALGDPRGDARKREQEDMKNAMLQRQMQMKEFEFGQTQAEAQRAERQRQLEAARKANRARIIGESLYQNRQPQQADPILPSVLNQLSEQAPQMQAAPASPMTGGAPMTSGAPIEQAQGQAFTDPATGKEGASYTATAMSRGPMLTEDEILELEARDAYKNGDFDYFDDRITLRRQKMTEEEKRGRQQIALAAGPIMRLPTHEARVLAVKQAMQSLGVSADETRIDDFFNDPQGLMLELQLAESLGDPENRLKENIRVGGTFEQFRPLERQDLGNRVGVFDPRTGEFGSGPSIGVSPNTNVTAGVQRRGQDISAATTRRGQNMTDARARTNLPAGFILDGN
jgi:hypothetical protein